MILKQSSNTKKTCIDLLLNEQQLVLLNECCNNQKTTSNKTTVKSFFIHWTFNFVYFVGYRTIHEFKIPTKHKFNLIAACLI